MGEKLKDIYGWRVITSTDAQGLIKWFDEEDANQRPSQTRPQPS